ncbi:hypothetical protein [Streptomyces sp. ID05-18]|uniref:hypothetical protein n=1 Tax=Streptomyces sp. ID05-18 TaxID=3028662 RepID=UPI0029A10170|nr:hypothetical protein [Streptomyces sp. ID05-18]MDX3490950.1 hypothetical protein [Streptomyces sp. ID05-18]
MPADLYTRYMSATDTWGAHLKGCPTCTAQRRCPAGSPLWERFERLQNAYLTHLRDKKGTP